MKAGIFAAGTGSRFALAGYSVPKPLVPILGRPLISYVLEGLIEGGVGEVHLLLNEEPRFDEVEAYVTRLPGGDRVRVWRKTTASSFESFRFLIDRLGRPPFLLSAVDTIVSARELEAFLRTDAYPPACRLALAVTDFVHDEKPCWAEVRPDGRIGKLGDAVTEKRSITAGLYLILQELCTNIPGGKTYPALRDFLMYLVRDGDNVWAKSFSMAVDVDRPDDIPIAESVLKEMSTKGSA